MISKLKDRILGSLKKARKRGKPDLNAKDLKEKDDWTELDIKIGNPSDRELTIITLEVKELDGEEVTPIGSTEEVVIQPQDDATLTTSFKPGGKSAPEKVKVRLRFMTGGNLKTRIEELQIPQD